MHYSDNSPPYFNILALDNQYHSKNGSEQQPILGRIATN
jgi:hypothetical protein